MKKIRILSILMVVLMLLSSFSMLIACDDEKEPETPDGDDEENSSKTTRPRGDNTGGGLADTTVPDGYIVYQNFDSFSLGSFTKGTGIATAIKTGASMNIVDMMNQAGDNTTKALQIYRTEGNGTTDTDSFINITPTASKLEETYVLEFSFYLGADCEEGIGVNGRKEYGGGGKFNQYLWISPAGTLEAKGGGGLKIDIEKETWYKVALVINDEACTYDLYVDGMLYAEGITNQASDYPKQSEASINLYRITMSGSSKISNFYLDDIYVYNGNKPNEVKGSAVPNYQHVSLEDIILFEANADADVKQFYYTEVLEKVEKGELDAKNGIALVGISKATGDIKVLSSSDLSTVDEIDEGYEYYLQVKDFSTFMAELTLNFDAEKLTALGVEATKDFKGNDTWDLSRYKRVEFEFYVPASMSGADKTYGFLVCVDCGQAESGWSYYMKGLETKGSYFTKGDGSYTFSELIEGMGASRTPDTTTMQFISLKFSGWDGTCGLDKKKTAADGYAIYLKSAKLTGGGYDIEVPRSNDETCTHVDADGNSLLGEEMTMPATCVNYGYNYKQCSKCGYVEVINDLSKLKEPSGHDFGTPADNPTYDIVYPTCTTGGYSDAACKVCGKVERQQTYSPLGHEYTTVIDIGTNSFKQTCVNCGDKVSLPFAEKLPTYDELVDSIDNGDYTVHYKWDLSGEAVTSENVVKDEDKQVSTIINGTNVCLFHRWYSIGDNEGVDGVNKYFTMGSATSKDYQASNYHSYVNVTNKNVGTSDLVYQISIRLGQIGVDGKYNTGSVELADRSTGPRVSVVLANFTETGGLKCGNYEIVLSQDKFTTVAFAVHPGTQTVDVYVDGRLKTTVSGIANLNSSFKAQESRFLNMSSTVGYGSTMDVANFYIYSGTLPVTILGFDSETADVEFTNSYVGELFKDDGGEIKSDKTIMIEDVANKKNSEYTLSFDIAAGSSAKSFTLVKGLKSNKYYEDLSENFILVDEDGDMLFYDQYVGSFADGGKIKLVFNDELGTVTLYINDTFVASSAYSGADYGNASEGAYFTGATFGRVAEGAYSISNILAVTIA